MRDGIAMLAIWEKIKRNRLAFALGSIPILVFAFAVASVLAASPYISIQPENAVLSNVTVHNDQNASGGKYVAFGSNQTASSDDSSSLTHNYIGTALSTDALIGKFRPNSSATVQSGYEPGI